MSTIGNWPTPDGVLVPRSFGRPIQSPCRGRGRNSRCLGSCKLAFMSYIYVAYFTWIPYTLASYRSLIAIVRRIVYVCTYCARSTTVVKGSRSLKHLAFLRRES
jgi:hypothetical protein